MPLVRSGSPTLQKIRMLQKLMVVKNSRYIISFISFFSDSCAERYFLAGPGNLCSSLNGKVIDDANECSDAANSIGKLFDGELRNQELLY